MEPRSDQEAQWIRRAAEDVISERRPPGHELTAEEEREVNRLVVNRRLAGEARDLETYRIVHGHLVRLYAESYARWIRGRRGTGARVRPRMNASTAGRGLPPGEDDGGSAGRTIPVTGATVLLRDTRRSARSIGSALCRAARP